MANNREGMGFFETYWLILVVLKDFDLIDWPWLAVIFVPIVAGIVCKIINAIIDYVLD